MIEENGSMRNSGSGVILKHLWLSAFIPNALCLNEDLGFQADGEARAIGEIDLKIGAITTIFKDGA